MHITQEQISKLDSLVVERIRDDVDNIALLRTFYNGKNENLTKTLHSDATIDKDSSGVTAYYLVKTQQGELLLYFSLKCGELFEGLDFEKLELASKLREIMPIILTNEDTESEQYKSAIEFIHNNIDKVKNILPDFEKYIEKKGLYNLELQKEINSKIQRVLKTYPAIEIVEFCSNENARDTWRGIGLPESKKMGECVFWFHIVPILQKIQDLIGCQYVYLFAADSSYDENLINYYKSRLKFEQPLTLGANKPQYDFACTFLCQQLSTLLKERESFFKNFLPDEDVV